MLKLFRKKMKHSGNAARYCSKVQCMLYVTTILQASISLEMGRISHDTFLFSLEAFLFLLRILTCVGVLQTSLNIHTGSKYTCYKSYFSFQSHPRIGAFSSGKHERGDEASFIRPNGTCFHCTCKSCCC